MIIRAWSKPFLLPRGFVLCMPWWSAPARSVTKVVKALGLIGVGAITIVDPDLVEPSNLTRSIFSPPRRSRAGKAVSVAASAAALFPDTRFNALAAEIADVGLRLVSEAHLLFGCLDSDLARSSSPMSRPASIAPSATPASAPPTTPTAA